MVRAGSGRARRVFRCGMDGNPVAECFNKLARRCRVRASILTRTVLRSKVAVRCVLFSSYCVSSVRITCSLGSIAGCLVTDPARMVTCKFPCRRYKGCLVKGISCRKIVRTFCRFCDRCACPCNATTIAGYRRLRRLTGVIGEVGVRGRGGGVSTGDVRMVSKCAPAVFFSFRSCVGGVYGSDIVLSRFSGRLEGAVLFGYRAPRCCSTFGKVLPVGRCSNVAASSPDDGELSGPGVCAQ